MRKTTISLGRAARQAAAALTALLARLLALAALFSLLASSGQHPAAAAPLGAPAPPSKHPAAPLDTFQGASGIVQGGLPQLDESSVAWGDYDNDGRLDFLLTGSAVGSSVGKLYHNTGSGFADASGLVPGFPQVYGSSLTWGDYDNDGLLDFLITGNNSSGPVSKLYHNTGSGFTDASGIVQGGLPQVFEGSVAWGDYDNDGRLDFLLTGSAVGGSVGKLYHNTGTGFVDASSLVPGFPQVGRGSVAWGDYDNDGRLDFLLTGENTTGYAASYLYHNTGSGFVDASGSVLGGLPQVEASSVAWGDYDNDGQLDFLISGCTDGVCHMTFSKLYHNTGSGFADASSIVQGGLPQVEASSVAWGDYDNDGRLDFLISGFPPSGFPSVSKLYRNTGSGFVDASAAVPNFPQVDAGSVAWGDYDDDGRLDFLITGYNGTSGVSKLYHNTGGAANTAPSAPSNLQAFTLDPSTILLQWHAASDGQTPAGGLNYNLRVGTTPGGSDVVGPMANTSTGFRRLSWLGPAQGTSRPLAGLTPGSTYYWSAQAIDSALAGGAFAAEGTFVAGAQPTPVPSPSPTPCAITFSDVHPTDYFYTPVTYLYCHGVVSGYADGTFRPYTFTTRAQFVKFVILGFALPIQTPAGGQYTFTDVPPTAPQFDVVETASALGIIGGYACGGPNEPCDAQNRRYFRPHANVSRGQVAKIDVLAAGWPLLNPATGTFDDVLPGTAYYQYVETIACRGIMSGYTCGGPGEPCNAHHRPYFRPGNDAVRGQLAKIVYLSLTASYSCPP